MSMNAVHAIGVELGKPADMTTAVRISLLLCAVIYFTIGIFGYLLFGDSIMADILVNFDQGSGSAVGSLLNDVVRLSYAFHLMLVFPLLNFSLRSNIDELFFPNKTLLARQQKIYVPHFCSISLLLPCSYSHPKYMVVLSVYGIDFCCLPCFYLPRCNCTKVKVCLFLYIYI